VLYEFNQRAVVQGPLADFTVEIDALQNVLERVRVGVLDGGESFVQPGANRRFQVSDAVVPAFVVGEAPTSLLWHEEVIFVRVGQLLFNEVGLQPLGRVLSPQCFPISLELVVQPLQKQNAEDVFLELRRIHVASEDVARLEELPFEPSEGQTFSLLLGDRMGR